MNKKCIICFSVFETIIRGSRAKTCSPKCAIEKDRIYRQSEKHKKSLQKCMNSDRYKEIQNKYKNSKKYKETREKYFESKEFKIKRNQYLKSESGKIAIKKGGMKRRAIKKQAQSFNIDLDFIKMRDGGRCQICGKKINFELKHPHKMSLQYDHVLPLSKGGIHSTANIQLSHKICNNKKLANIKQGIQQNLF